MSRKDPAFRLLRVATLFDSGADSTEFPRVLDEELAGETAETAF